MYTHKNNNVFNLKQQGLTGPKTTKTTETRLYLSIAQKFDDPLPFKLTKCEHHVFDLPGTYTSVRDMPHASSGIAEVLEQTLHLVLNHARTYCPHHLTVGSTAHLVHIAQYCKLSRRLNHTARRWCNAWREVARR